MSYNLRPKELSEPTKILEKMKKNPLALELFQTTNKQRRVEGKPPIQVRLWRNIEWYGDSDAETGEIRIKNSNTQEVQLETLIFELCNISRVDPPNLNLAIRRYPMRRENYIREMEKTEWEAGNRMLKIYNYGVTHLGWNPTLLKENIELFKQPFEQYYADLYTYDEGKKHCEHYGSWWDEIDEYMNA